MSIRIIGKVVQGQGRGRDLGFPTANLELSSPLPDLQPGIYGCRAFVPRYQEKYLGALHVGPRPTFGEATPSVEVHLLDFARDDIYGEEIILTDLKWFRPVENFPSVETLVAAITADCEQVRKIYADS